MEEAKIEKELKKNKNKNKVASLLLALALILTCGVAGTIAQYQKSLGGTSTATVAKFKVSAGNLTADKKADLKLFDNVVDSTGAIETDVAKIGGDGANKNNLKIAPGTRGSVKVDLSNESDVTVDYQLTFELKNGTGVLNKYIDSQSQEKTNGTIPLEFALTIGNATAPTSDSDWVSLSAINADQTKSKGTLSIPASGQASTTRTVYLHWRWAYTTGQNGGTPEQQKAFDDRNDLDTAIGEIMQYLGKDANGSDSGNANVAVAPSNGTLPSTLTNTSTFTLPEVTAGVLFTQAD